MKNTIWEMIKSGGVALAIILIANQAIESDVNRSATLSVIAVAAIVWVVWRIYYYEYVVSIKKIEEERTTLAEQLQALAEQMHSLEVERTSLEELNESLTSDVKTLEVRNESLHRSLEVAKQSLKDSKAVADEKISSLGGKVNALDRSLEIAIQKFEAAVNENEMLKSELKSTKAKIGGKEKAYQDLKNKFEELNALQS